MDYVLGPRGGELWANKINRTINLHSATNHRERDRIDRAPLDVLKRHDPARAARATKNRLDEIAPAVSVLTWRGYGHLRSWKATHSVLDASEGRGEGARPGTARRDEKEGAGRAFERRAFKRSSPSEKKTED